MDDYRPNPHSRLFLTKAWGFNPESNPTIGFIKIGGRNNFLRKANRDDWIVIAGTLSDPTPPEEQGRLLGICHVGHDEVDAAEIMKEIGVELSPHLIDKNGDYKWRWAMPILGARRFLHASSYPSLVDVFGSNLPGQDWAAYAIDLEERFGQELVNLVKALPSEPCEIASLPVLDKARVYADQMGRGRRKGNSGPPPSGSRGGIDRTIGEGFAYAFQLEGRSESIFKIGYSHDYQERLETLNREIRPSVTGCQWKIFMTHEFTTENYAYNFEQVVLKRFQEKLFDGEKEIVRATKDEITAVWTDVLHSQEWID
jgi:hypothetical protein